MPDGDLAEVEALERRLLDPGTRSSSEALHKLIDDDFIEIGRSGRIWTKSEIVEELLEEQSLEIEMDSVQSRRIGEDVILIIYRSRRVGVAQTADAIRSSIWQRRKKNWQIVFHQGTPAQL
jgi:hypothetical protein